MHKAYNKYMQYIAIQLKGDIMEVWKDIQDYEGLYQISNFGKVKSLSRVDSLGHARKEKILNGKPDKDGYLRVGLRKNNKYRWFRVHRLVALMFIPNINYLAVVNHIDENKKNNQANNLEWCTVKYNNSYGSRLNKVSETLSIPVVATDKQGNSTVYKGINYAEKILGVNHSNIVMCLKDTGRKSAGGYTWKYAAQQSNKEITCK